MMKTLSALSLTCVLSCSSVVERRPDQGRGSVAAGGAPITSVEPSAAGEPASAPPPPELGWCDVQPIVGEKCARCHADPPVHGAPFALATYADVQRTDARGRPRYERMLGAIESELMPATFLELEPPVEELTQSERAALVEWLMASAPLGDESGCADTLE